MWNLEKSIQSIEKNNSLNESKIENFGDIYNWYKEYNNQITSIKLDNLKLELSKKWKAEINSQIQKFIDWTLTKLDLEIDTLINNLKSNPINEVLIAQKLDEALWSIKGFKEAMQLIISWKKEDKKQLLEKKELKKYKNNKDKLSNLLNDNFDKKLKTLDSLFKEEWKFSYYNTHFKLEDALWKDFKDIDKKYGELSQISILWMQNIFLNQWIALSEVNRKIIKLIDNSSYSTEDKIKQIKKAINEVEEFEKKIDNFIEKTKQIEELDETEVDDKLLKTVIKWTWSVLTEAAKIFVAPIWFWAWIKENTSWNTNTWIQDSAEFAASFVPIVWNFVDFAQAISWETYSGRELSTWERWLAVWTWTLWLVLDLTWMWYFLRSGWKLAVKWWTTIAKWAIRWSDNLLKATVKESWITIKGKWIFIWNLNKIKWNFKANFWAVIDWIAEKKLWILKEYWAYAKKDMKSIVWVDMIKWIWKWMKTWFIRSINFTWEKNSFSWAWLEKKESWKWWESFWHSENLSKLEKTDIIKEAWITVDKDWKITDSELEISDKIDALFNWNKITRGQILEKINAHEWTDEEKVKAFMMEIWITDKSIIGQVKDSWYNKLLLRNLIFIKQHKQLNDPDFIKFKENIKRNLYKNEQYFDSNYLAPQRNLSEIDLKMSNKEDTFVLFWKDTNWEKLSPNWYKNEKINWYNLLYRWNSSNISLDNLKLWTSDVSNNIYKYIKDNKISNVDDLANQLKRDNKLQLYYTNNNDFRITRQTAEQAWDNAFTTKIKSLDDEISTLKKDIKNLEKESKKLDDDFKVNTTNRKKIIKDWTILKNLETNPETQILFNSLDTLWDYKNLKTDLNDILTLKNEAIITTEKQIVDLKNILLSKDKPSDTLTNNVQTQITSLNNELAQLKTSQNNIKTAIKQFERNINSFEKTQKKTAKIQTENKKLEARIEEKAEIEKSLADTKERTPLFKEVTELDIDKVKSRVIDNYIKHSNDYIAKWDKLEDVIDKVKTKSWETDTDIVNNTALYIWKLSNPDIWDSLKLFIEKMNIKDHNTIFNKLTNEKWRAKFSDLLETLETELKNTENKFWKEYLTKLKEYNNLHFLGKNSNTFKELFNYKKAIDNWEKPKEYLRRNPNLKKIMNIPELSEYITNPTKLEQLFWAIGKYSMKVRIAKKVVEKVAPSVKKGTEKAKEAFKNANEDYWK